jgi:hypothetical protein
MTKHLTIDQATQAAFERYQYIIAAYGVDATNHSNDEFSKLTKWQQLAHCRWMTEHQMHPNQSHHSIDKKSRWLGFIQGVLIVHGITSIEKERNITRPWFTKT